MYYIRKSAQKWAVHNNFTGKSRSLNDEEVRSILNEFPNLKNGVEKSSSLTFFRNRIKSISDLP
ncbi:MAG: hypothetical protein MRZ79_11250 [Bacteroidia bacterium]|nr:hypothetical protein [Bacteroidia bacterium]